MKIYIIHCNSLEHSYKIEAFANKKKAISKFSKLNREYRKKIRSIKKDPILNKCININKSYKIITKDFPISREGLLTAINYI